jgi:hypothetical protein
VLKQWSSAKIIESKLVRRQAGINCQRELPTVNKTVNTVAAVMLRGFKKINMRVFM